MSSDKTPRSDRLRTHPAERFADDEQIIDLGQCYQTLLGEDHKAVDGHRQYTLSRRGSLTVILFHFNEGSRIPEHTVHGGVTIHVLDGELEIKTPSQTHILKTDQLLALNGGVKHDVYARAETRMLLTIELASKGA